MIESIFSSLLNRLVESGFQKLKSNAEFLSLRRLAHERIGRELFWNLECISNCKANERAAYLKLMRTDAFDDLVKLGAPLDDIFDAPIVALSGLPSQRLSTQLRRRLNDISRLSMLLDRTYNRTWMLRHRVQNNLALGDLAYLRQLLRLSHSEVARCRDSFVDRNGLLVGTSDMPCTLLSTSDPQVW
jgi:hypothetical protein